MKIVIDARLYGLENAGLGRYLINLVSELGKVDKENNYSILLRKKYFDELRLPSNWKKVLVDLPHYSLSEQLRLPKILRDEQPDLVHFPHMNVPKFYKGKFVVTVHDLLMQKHRGASATTLPFYVYFPKLIASKYIFKHAVKNARKILVPSDSVKNEVFDYYKVNKSKIITTYEGVDERFKAVEVNNSLLQKYNLNENYYLFVGNAYPHKNLERTIQAFASTQNYLVIVTARNVFTRKLKDQIRKIKAEKFIKVLGYVDDRELVALYKQSQGFIYPSLSEGFGLPGLEAMSTGTLLLASNISVFKEVYKNVPIYFDPYSISSIAEAIIRSNAISNEQKNHLIAEGRKLVQNYSWRQMAIKTLEVYKEALK